MNLYSMVKNDVICGVDYLGMLIIVVEVDRNSTAGKANYSDQTNKYFSEHFKEIDRFLNSLTKEKYDCVLKRDRVKFNGEKYTGTYEQFTDLVRREKESKYILQTSGSFSDAVGKYRQLVGDFKSKESWDSFFLGIHGDNEGNAHAGGATYNSAKFKEGFEKNFGETPGAQCGICYSDGVNQVNRAGPTKAR